MTKTKERPMLEQNPLRNHLYNTSVLPLMIKQNDMFPDIEVEVHDENIIPKIIIHKTDTVLLLEIVLVMTKHNSSTIQSFTL